MRRLVMATLVVMMGMTITIPAFAQDKAQKTDKASIKSPAPLLKESDRLWKTRNHKGNAQKSFDAAEAALKTGADEFEARYRIARGAFWVAEWTKSKKIRKDMGWRGYEEGLKASRLKPNRVEGYYYGVISLGQYSLAIGVFRAIGKGVKGKFTRLGNKAVKLNAKFDGGGPDRAMAVFWRDMPRIVRDLDKAEKHIKDAIRFGKKYPRNHYYFAEILLMTGRRAQAKSVLNKCSKLNPREADYADAIIWTKKCSKLLAKEFPSK